jgi:hypothetical protein
MIEYNHDTPPERWMMKHELEPIWDGSIDYGASSSRDCLRKNEGTELIGGSRLAVRFVGRNTFVTADRKNHLRKADRKNHLRKRGGGGCAGAPSGRIAGLTDGGLRCFGGQGVAAWGCGQVLFVPQDLPCRRLDTPIPARRLEMTTRAASCELSSA